MIDRAQRVQSYRDIALYENKMRSCLLAFVLFGASFGAAFGFLPVLRFVAL